MILSGILLIFVYFFNEDLWYECFPGNHGILDEYTFNRDSDKSKKISLFIV